MLAEDDDVLKQALTQILSVAGYEVTSLVDGLEIVKNQCDAPDLFIIDIQMTVIDGLAVCKFLRINKCTRAIPVILMSGRQEYRKRALEVGADHFLSKPIIADELLQIIDNLTTKWDQAEQVG